MVAGVIFTCLKTESPMAVAVIDRPLFGATLLAKGGRGTAKLFTQEAVRGRGGGHAKKN